MGFNKNDGYSLSGLEHIKQSIADILTTPIGSRVQRRDYGCGLFEMIDTPVNDNTKIEFFAVITAALRKWEPRVKITKVSIVSVDEQGRLSLDITGVILSNGEELKMEGLLVA